MQQTRYMNNGCKLKLLAIFLNARDLPFTSFNTSTYKHMDSKKWEVYKLVLYVFFNT